MFKKIMVSLFLCLFLSACVADENKLIKADANNFSSSVEQDIIRDLEKNSVKLTSNDINVLFNLLTSQDRVIRVNNPENLEYFIKNNYWDNIILHDGSKIYFLKTLDDDVINLSVSKVFIPKENFSFVYYGTLVTLDKNKYLIKENGSSVSNKINVILDNKYIFK